MSKKNHTLIIPDTHANERLDQALAKLLPEYSRTQLKAWIDQENVTVDGKVVKAKTKLLGGEQVDVIATLDAHLNESAAEAIDLPIFYEDESLLIINKPVGMVVHPGAGNPTSTLLNALLHHDPHLKNLPRAGILHRLDKDTSGLLLVAKTAHALKHLGSQLKKRSVVREYQAIVYGTLISGGTVDAPIGRHPLQRKRMTVTEAGKVAVTHYRIAEKYRHTTRLKVRLETGRTHQIRVHLSHIHHPLVGDATYGGRVQLSKGMSENAITTLRRFKRQALHAFALGFEHPVTHEHMHFETELPADMQALIQALREDVQGEKT